MEYIIIQQNFKSFYLTFFISKYGCVNFSIEICHKASESKNFTPYNYPYRVVNLADALIDIAPGSIDIRNGHPVLSRFELVLLIFSCHALDNNT